MTFSYFNPPITNTLPSKETSLEEVYKMITSDDHLKILTEEVRSGTKSKDDDLPFITPSGLFKRRKLSELISYSGILSIDIDDINTAIRTSLQRDSFLPPSLVFVSPSGNGLKLFYNIGNAISEDHLIYFNAIESYLKKIYGLDIDKGCKDIPRPCWLCHDAEAFLNPDAVIEASALIESFRVWLTPISDSEFQSFRKEECNTETLKRCNTETISSSAETLNSHPFLHTMAVSALNKAGWKENGDRWTRPGKDRGTSAVFNYYEPYGCPIFYCFSSNGKPFEGKKGYNDLGVI